MANIVHRELLDRPSPRESAQMPPRIEHPIERMLRLLAATAIILAGLCMALGFIGMVVVFTLISFAPAAH